MNQKTGIFGQSLTRGTPLHISFPVLADQVPAGPFPAGVVRQIPFTSLTGTGPGSCEPGAEDNSRQIAHL